MKRRRFIAVAILLVGGAALFVLQRSRATAPVSLRPLLYLVADTEREAERIPLALTRVSDEEENEIGEDLARKYGLVPGRFTDPDTQSMANYVNMVGQRVAQRVRRKTIHYNFYLDNNAFLVNAYAMPGGQIVMGRGLLALLETEDELAAILGHEITHVDRRHAIERLQYELASRKLGLGELYRLTAPVVQVFEAGYTKEQELEADRVGLDLAVAAGYSPQGGINVMKRFEQMESQASLPAGSVLVETMQVSLGSLEEYFRSHPPAAERRAAMEAEIAAHHWSVTASHRPLAVRHIFLTESGEKLDGEGKFKEALDRFEEAVRLQRDYTPAWRGIERTSWRMGDAKQAAAAGGELARRDALAEDWTILARALSIADPENSVSRLAGLLTALPPSRTGGEAFLVAQTDLAGLKFTRGRSDALGDYQSAQSIVSDGPIRAHLGREMAWWMYRAGNLDEAQKELEAAWQLQPSDAQIYLDLAWVLSDLGKQGDANEWLEKGPSRTDARLAALAVIQWRTSQADAADRSFRTAAAGNPAWMVPAWVENNFSASAARVLKQLQAAENARRLKEIGEQAARSISR